MVRPRRAPAEVEIPGFGGHPVSRCARRRARPEPTVLTDEAHVAANLPHLAATKAIPREASFVMNPAAPNPTDQ